jgi:flagellar protein FliO/FliZ
MDLFAIMRMLASLGVVLGMLAGALWVVKRFDVKLPGRIGGGTSAMRRLEIVERLSIDPKRSLVLLRQDGEEHLVLMSPEGHVVLERKSLAAESADGSVPPYAALMAQAIERLWTRLADEADTLRQPVIAHHA